MRYSIDPTGVAKVLDQTAAQGNSLLREYRSLRPIIDAAAEGAGGSGLIVAALDLVITRLDESADFSRLVVASCLTGADNATLAYIHGDEEMAQEYASRPSLDGPVFPAGPPLREPERNPANPVRNTANNRRAGRGQN